MHNVSTKDCFRLANGDRPFDYFYEKPNSSTPVQASSASNFSSELINSLARLEAEKMIAAQNANVQVEQIPLGEPKPKF